jgi:hypothetical protein
LSGSRLEEGEHLNFIFSVSGELFMGLHVHSLSNIPKSENRDYLIYLLEYGWHEPLAQALNNNFRGFKFEVQQLRVAWCNVFPPRRIPRAEFYIQALFEAGG